MRFLIRPVVAGLALSLSLACSSSRMPSGSSPVLPANSTVVYTAIAASDGLGIGSTGECFLFEDCPNGKGYVQVAGQQLRARGYMVTITNPSIPTATIGRDFQDLGNQNGHAVFGNFIENEAPVTPAATNLITIFAGGNDVNVVTAALGRGAGASDQIGYITTQVSAFASDYSKLLSMLRSRAPDARIIVLNLPNMGALPFLAGASVQQRQAAQRLSAGMTTTAINPLTNQGVVVIDMMCDARAYQSSTYSTDGFHPSDTGYAWMAAEVVAAATTTTYRSPQASCAQMSLIPQ